MLTVEDCVTVIQVMVSGGMRLPSKIVTAEDMRNMATVWALCLHDVPPDELLAGALAMISHAPSGWVPSPGELRGYLPEAEPTASAAFAIVLRIAEHPHDWPELSPRVRHALACVGGVTALGKADRYQMPALRRAFVAAYEDHRTDEAVAQARGILAATPLHELPASMATALLELTDLEQGADRD